MVNVQHLCDGAVSITYCGHFLCGYIEEWNCMIDPLGRQMRLDPKKLAIRHQCIAYTGIKIFNANADMYN